MITGSGGIMTQSIGDDVFIPLGISDGPEVVTIFNYYIENSNAAFLDHPVPESFYEHMLGLLGSYPSAGIRNEKGKLIGFGMIRPHNTLPAFVHTAEVSYFISPSQTGMGIGGAMLSYLEKKGNEMGISCLLAQISSLNEGSIRFHQKHGFTQCGRFQNAGKKNGQFFDTVWMQKSI
jgi:L-amino acid N-acyltransferase YncA